MRLVLFALLPLTLATGCDEPPPQKKVAPRALRAEEAADAALLCAAVLACNENNCGDFRPDEVAHYDKVKMQTFWGNQLKKTFIRAGTANTTIPFVEKLRKEQIGKTDPACKTLVGPIE